MRRSRKFLSFIVVLLAINTLFFVSWYVFDVQGRVKGIAENEAGKALKGEFRIGFFTISSQQVYAEKISFAAADSLLNFTVDNARVRFNLLRFIFSGFKMRNLMDHIEIDKADVQLAVVPKAKKAKKKFEIPDLKPIFNKLTITNSSFKADVKVPLKLGEEGLLTVMEELSQVDLTIHNTNVSNLGLSATTSSRGTLNLNGILDKGRIASSRVELRNYEPLYLSHPQIRDFRGNLDLAANVSQPKKGSDSVLNAHLVMKDASAFVWQQYPVNIPLLDITSDGSRLNASLAQSTVGSSSISGDIRARDLFGDLIIDSGQVDLRVDLSMLGANFSGWVDGTLNAEGKLSDPVLQLAAASNKLSFSGQTVENVDLIATYKAKEVDLALRDLIWQNQRVDLTGSFSTEERKLTAKLDTEPIRRGIADLKVTASADVELDFYSAVPEIRALIHGLDFAQNKLDYRGLSGYANLVPLITDNGQNYLVDAELRSPLGIELSLVGDINDRNFLLEGELNSVQLASVYPDKSIEQFRPLLSGGISAFLAGSKAVLSAALSVDWTKDLNIGADIDLIASYDLKTKQGDLVLDTPYFTINGEPLTLGLVAGIQDQELKISSFNLNKQIMVSGGLDLKDIQDLQFQVVLADIGSEMLQSYFPNLQLPQINGVNLTASYSSSGTDFLDAVLSVAEVNIPGLKPMSAELTLLGDPRQVNIQGAIRNESTQLVDLVGDAVLDKGWNLRLNALATELNTAELMYSPPVEGSVSGNIGLFIADVLTGEREFSFDARLLSSRLSIPNVADLDDVLVSVAQTKNLLIVDTLSVRSSEFGSLSGSGALDYNILNRTIFEGNHTLNLRAEGMLFEWLDKEYEYVREASGKANLECNIRTLDDQLMVQSGVLRISEGRLVLDDQPEDIRNIELSADIEENRVTIRNLTAQMGNGVLHAINHFDGDPESHLKAAMLDLGTLLVKVDEPGALLYVPDITAPRSRARIVLRGQNAEYATVTGPFDDMMITAEALVSEASIVYPPRTNNLLNLIYSFRGSLGMDSEPKREAIPLPFNLDLKVFVQDNVKYATYPTNFMIMPGGYMHILFDGSVWHPQESSITSEQGSMDFFGTKFAMKELNFSITGAQKMVTIEGTLTHETADGTIVTLNINTDKENPDQSILKRVNFTLDSDNPDDNNAASILSRMRYNDSSEQLSATQQGNLLQDEALGLISENLNTSLLSPLLYPLENNIRRLLRIDDFSIRAGFIENLFTKYTTNPNQLTGYTDLNQFVGNVSQFSSSILLNNLSIYMSKYLGRKFFLDYTLGLQEATDLQNRTQIVVSHEASLRWYLPAKFRLAYTFKYVPWDEQISHELMLQRSFKFWGL